MSDFLSHVGVAHDENPPGRGSGRFGYGTGKNPNQHQFDFLSEVDRMTKDGCSQLEIAQALLGKRAKAIDLRNEITIVKNEKRRFNYQTAARLLEECNGNISEVARRMGKNESTIRSYLDPIRTGRLNKYEKTAEMIKKRVDENGLVDLSSGAEHFLGVTDNTKRVAMQMLQREGYNRYYLKYEQQGTTNETNVVALARPDMTYSEAVKNKGNIKPIVDFTPDEGKTWWVPEFPASLDSKRVKVRYAEEGGTDKDGVIEIRKGVEDLSLGGSQYAQVRIAVDGTHYLKGMAMYGDSADFPKGVDIIFNTNKHTGTPMIGEKGHEVLKRLKIDKETGEVDRDNPFGALIKSPKDRDGVLSAAGQRHYIDANGKEQLSPINKLQDEGDWDSWSRNLSAQFLSKQPLKLIHQQMKISLAEKRSELETINALENPVIKKKLLEDFAGLCDSNAADLSVKGFKNQAFQVILPVPKMSEKEVYAPNYDDGDIVALIRYPHGGTFEIPVLKVNNRQPDAKKVMGSASDAIGIHPRVAEQLSGADFDGDTVCVIPLKSNRLSIKHTDPLPELKGYDPKEIYKLPDSAPEMKAQTKQNEMGRITNLITDMTVGGATIPQITRAVKHSMTVIDAEKHHLDYRRSAKENRIEDLKEEFQGGAKKGASTILSKAGSEERVPKRNEVTDVKKMTPEEVKRWEEGKVVYHTSTKKKATWKKITDPKKMTEEELKVYESGKKVYRYEGDAVPLEKVKRMYLVDDATELVRNPSNQKEMAYARYANELKGMANEARRTARAIKPYEVSTSAKATYAEEVESLNQKLVRAKMNQPKERIAQALAGTMVSEKVKSNPDIDYEHKQRLRAQCLTKARAIVGAKKDVIDITDREWEAIQAHAVSSSRLKQILLNTDQDKFKQRATPRKEKGTLTDAKLNLLRAMASSGMYTQKEIADALGISASAVSKALRNN